MSGIAHLAANSHLPGSVDPIPTTMQRLLVDTPADRFRAYLDVERDAGERYLGSSGRVHWLASFAPLEPGELRALVFDVASPAVAAPIVACQRAISRENALGYA